MRGELVNGLAGARKIYAQLKQGKQREQELRATNSILQAKIAASSSSSASTGEGERQGGGATAPRIPEKVPSSSKNGAASTAATSGSDRHPAASMPPSYSSA
ncbi:unnamed protein product, partial [Ectocarpus sp. 12 AP-2014]